MTDFRERTIEVRGLPLRVRERGPEGAPAVVLLHGWLDQRGSFDLLAPLLGDDVHTIALDHRGHGDSGWVGAGGFYHFVEYVADLDGALDALGLALPQAAPVRLVGHSLGAAVALIYSATRPSRVAHAALLDGAPLMTRVTEIPLRIQQYLDDLRLPRTRKIVQSLDQAIERMLRAQPTLPEPVARHLAGGGVGPDPTQQNALAWKWDPLVRAHSPLPFSESVLDALLPEVKAPVLLLRAAHGILPDAAELRERLGKIARLTVEEVPGVGHHLHLQNAESVAERIRAAWLEAGFSHPC